jgi:hypothetical protein
MTPMFLMTPAFAWLVASAEPVCAPVNSKSFESRP